MPQSHKAGVKIFRESVGKFRLFLVTLACWTLLAGSAAVAANEADDLAVLDNSLRNLIDDSLIPGASIAVIENGEIVFIGAYGITDHETGLPVTPRTVFRAGSISKSFTALGIMMLEEAGALDISDTLATHLPKVPVSNRWAESDPVRLSHLLEHTAGLNDIAFRHYLISSSDIDLETAVELYGPYTARWRPGTRTSYSNAGPILAGRVLETASGQSFTDFMHSQLLNPLGMTDSSWTVTEAAENGQLARSYQSDGLTPEPVIDPPGRPSGGLNTTARDLAQLPRLMLARGTLDGVEYLRPETARRIEHPTTSSAARAGLAFGLGLGNESDVAGPTVWLGHDGTIDGFRAAARYSHDLNAGYVILVNALSPGFEGIENELRTYLEEGMSLPVIDAVLLAPEVVDRIEGQYQTITPRRELLAPIIGLTQWEGASLDGSRLQFRRESLIHVGNRLFHAEGHVVPSTVLIETNGRMELHTGFGAYRQVSKFELWTKVSAIGLSAAVMAAAIFYALIWIPSFALGRLRKRGGPAPRAWPATALLLALSAALMPLVVLQTASFETLGQPSLTGWTLFVLTILAPISVFIAVASLVRAHRASLPVIVIGALQCTISLIICCYLAWGGWFALRIWTA
jgi:CubicO group peptidase (beta-lactamase class C family)